MIFSDDKVVELTLNIDLNDPHSFDLTLRYKFSQEQIDNFLFYIVIERGLWREEHQINNQIFINQDIHNFNIKSAKIKNDEGTIRFYATEEINEIPVKRLFSNKYKLGYLGGSSTDSLLNIRLVGNLKDLLFFVDVEDEEPVLLIHQEDNEKYAEKFILGAELFKAGILPDIISDIQYICYKRYDELNSETERKWREFFDHVSTSTGIKIDSYTEREDVKKLIGQYLTNFNYRKNFITKVLGEDNEQF